MTERINKRSTGTTGTHHHRAANPTTTRTQRLASPGEVQIPERPAAKPVWAERLTLAPLRAGLGNLSAVHIEIGNEKW